MEGNIITQKMLQYVENMANSDNTKPWWDAQLHADMVCSYYIFAYHHIVRKTLLQKVHCTELELAQVTGELLYACERPSADQWLQNRVTD